MINANEVVKTGTKYGFFIHEYNNNFYLQPVNVVGTSAYLQNAAPTWKKNGREQIGQSKIVSFPLGDATQAREVLTKLIHKIVTNVEGQNSPTTNDDLPF